jgi:hypothetical protein
MQPASVAPRSDAYATVVLDYFRLFAVIRKLLAEEQLQRCHWTRHMQKKLAGRCHS